MNREIEEMVKVMCCDRKNFKSCKSCKSANPNTKAYCRIEHYAELLCKNDYRKSADVAREILALVWDAYQTTHYDAEFEERLDNIEKKYESEGEE